MDYFIKLFAAALARRIESGSRIGALFGTIIGIALGLALYLYLNSIFELPAALAIACAIPPAIAGALIGAACKKSKPLSPEAADQLLAQPVRASNFNHALIAPIFLLLALAGTVVSAWLLISGLNRTWEPIVLCPFMLAWTVLLSFATLRAIYWIELDSALHLRRLLTRRTYLPAQILFWTIKAASDSPNTSKLIAKFDDGTILDFPLSPTKSKLLAAKLLELAPQQLAAQ